MARWRVVRGSASDRGAAAVEFALVVPVLLLLVFGILDYGRFFFDSVSLRQGAREAARQAVVQQYGGCTGVNVGAKIACNAKAASDITIGTPLVHIPRMPDLTSSPPRPVWAQGGQLLVCMASKEQGTGFVPLPGGGGITSGYGILKTKVYMSIEVDKPTAVDPYFSGDDASATAIGIDWSWCL